MDRDSDDDGEEINQHGWDEKNVKEND